MFRQSIDDHGTLGHGETREDVHVTEPGRVLQHAWRDLPAIIQAQIPQLRALQEKLSGRVVRYLAAVAEVQNFQEIPRPLRHSLEHFVAQRMTVAATADP